MPSTLSTPQQEWTVKELKVARSTQGTTGDDAVITLVVMESGNPAVFHLTAQHVNALLQGLQDVVKARQSTFGV